MNKTLPCFCCNKKLTPALSEEENQPYNGTKFFSYGHYGSTYFDPMDGSCLEINICDQCLREKEKNILRKSVHNEVYNSFNYS